MLSNYEVWKSAVPRLVAQMGNSRFFFFSHHSLPASIRLSPSSTTGGKLVAQLSVNARIVRIILAQLCSGSAAVKQGLIKYCKLFLCGRNSIDISKLVEVTQGYVQSAIRPDRYALQQVGCNLTHQLIEFRVFAATPDKQVVIHICSRDILL